MLARVYSRYIADTPADFPPDMRLRVRQQTQKLRNYIKTHHEFRLHVRAGRQVANRPNSRYKNRDLR